MSGVIFRISLAVALFTTALPAAADELVLKSVDGVAHRPLAKEGKEKKAAVVLIFTATDCPVANYFQPTIRRLADEFDEKGVTIFQVYPDRDTDEEAAKTHAREYKITTPQVLDPDQKLARAAKAEKTPEAVVYGADGKVAYRGRIDDTYARPRKKAGQADHLRPEGRDRGRPGRKGTGGKKDGGHRVLHLLRGE